MTARFLALTLGALLLSGALSVVAVRVVSLERDELEHESAWMPLSALAARPDATRVSARLTSVRLRPGETAIFELCAQDPLSDKAWVDAFQLMVWQPASQQLELKVPLDAAHLALVKRSTDRACLPLGGGRVEREGTYAFDVVWAGKPPPAGLVSRVPLRARVLAKRELGVRDGVLICCAALGGSCASVPLLHQASRRSRRVATPWHGRSLAPALRCCFLHSPCGYLCPDRSAASCVDS